MARMIFNKLKLIVLGNFIFTILKSVMILLNN